MFAEAQERYRRPEPGPPPAALDLTPRQREVLACLVRGESNKQIARSLNLSEGTVKVHLAVVFERLGVSSRVAAAVVGAKQLGSEVQ
jgi:two-component system nitrate/nitrite response regulator NarL